VDVVFNIHLKEKENAMEKHMIHYDTFIRVTRAISQSRDPEEVVLIATESIKTAFKVKGCAIFLVDNKTNELHLAGSFGLSDTYLQKGPIHYIHSIREYIQEEPVAIYDVTDDPRIQYPAEAKEEGISSILGVPIIVHGSAIGVLRVYTAEPWDFTLMDVNLIQAVAVVCGMALDMCRLHKGYTTSIDILKLMRRPQGIRSNRWTPYEGVPQSKVPSICDY
jgi:signal transduction protein with GAF and PtsI domain